MDSTVFRDFRSYSHARSNLQYPSLSLCFFHVSHWSFRAIFFVWGVPYIWMNGENNQPTTTLSPGVENDSPWHKSRARSSSRSKLFLCQMEVQDNFYLFYFVVIWLPFAAGPMCLANTHLLPPRPLPPTASSHPEEVISHLFFLLFSFESLIRLVKRHRQAAVGRWCLFPVKNRPPCWFF